MTRIWHESSALSLTVFNQINLELKASVFLSTLLSVPLLASLLLVVSLSLPIAVSALVIGLDLWILWRCLTRLALLQHPKSIIRIRLSPDSTSLYDASGCEIPVNLAPDSFVSRWFCILRFEAVNLLEPGSTLPGILRTRTMRTRFLSRIAARQCWSLIVCDDNVCNTEHLRRLRVISRYGKLMENQPVTDSQV